MPPREESDPTLPPGWKCIVDTDSGLRYYWNPGSNTTTYERPAGGGVRVGGGWGRGGAIRGRAACGAPRRRAARRARGAPGARARAALRARAPRAAGAGGPRPARARRARASAAAVDARPPTRLSPPPPPQTNGGPPPPPGPPGGGPRAPSNHKFGPTDGFAESADAYRKRHDLTVVSRGGQVPDPLQTFESTGFTEEIMREVSVWGGGGVRGGGRGARGVSHGRRRARVLWGAAARWAGRGAARGGAHTHEEGTHRGPAARARAREPLLARRRPRPPHLLGGGVREWRPVARCGPPPPAPHLAAPTPRAFPSGERGPGGRAGAEGRRPPPPRGEGAARLPSARREGAAVGRGGRARRAPRPRPPASPSLARAPSPALLHPSSCVCVCPSRRPPVPRPSRLRCRPSREPRSARRLLPLPPSPSPRTQSRAPAPPSTSSLHATDPQGGLHGAHPHSSPGVARRAARRRPHRHRQNRVRQDVRLPAARLHALRGDAQRPARGADDVRARADARARGADQGRGRQIRSLRRFPQHVRVRRRAQGAPAARPAQRGAPGHRDPRPPQRFPRGRPSPPRPNLVPRPGRSRPHARHGV